MNQICLFRQKKFYMHYCYILRRKQHHQRGSNVRNKAGTEQKEKIRAITMLFIWARRVPASPHRKILRSLKQTRGNNASIKFSLCCKIPSNIISTYLCLSQNKNTLNFSGNSTTDMYIWSSKPWHDYFGCKTIICWSLSIYLCLPIV